MSVWRLVVKEIRHRKLNFVLSVLSVLVAVATLVGALTLLDAYGRRTGLELKKLEDDYRKITIKLGFNVLVLPKDQSLAEVYADDYASKTMPESYVKKLSDASVMTINHLLPILQQKLKWPERERTVILVGTRGEIPILHRDSKNPIITAVQPGTMIVGYELHRSMKLEVGDKVKLLGRDFTVARCHEERGSKDDISIWIDLAEAQEMLGKKGLINAIMALSCHCEGARLAGIRGEIEKILPDTQVIEFASQAITRAETRSRAARHAHEAQAGREAFAAVLVPVVILGCAVWIAVLAFHNVRDRKVEIGVLRALGMHARGVLGVFLARAVLTGLAGAAVGYVVGFLAGTLFGGPAAARLDPLLLMLVIVLAPVLAAVASWIPALVASQQDPALVLREE